MAKKRSVRAKKNLSRKSAVSKKRYSKKRYSKKKGGAYGTGMNCPESTQEYKQSENILNSLTNEELLGLEFSQENISMMEQLLETEFNQLVQGVLSTNMSGGDEKTLRKILTGPDIKSELNTTASVVEMFRKIVATTSTGAMFWTKVFGFGASGSIEATGSWIYGISVAIFNLPWSFGIASSSVLIFGYLFRLYKQNNQSINEITGVECDSWFKKTILLFLAFCEWSQGKAVSLFTTENRTYVKNLLQAVTIGTPDHNRIIALWIRYSDLFKTKNARHDMVKLLNQGNNKQTFQEKTGISCDDTSIFMQILEVGNLFGNMSGLSKGQRRLNRRSNIKKRNQKRTVGRPSGTITRTTSTPSFSFSPSTQQQLSSQNTGQFTFGQQPQPQPQPQPMFLGQQQQPPTGS